MQQHTSRKVALGCNMTVMQYGILQNSTRHQQDHLSRAYPIKVASSDRDDLPGMLVVGCCPHAYLVMQDRVHHSQLLGP